jgi:hypothetical protein
MSLQVGYCWLWSLIIFTIQRFFLAVIKTHSLIGGVGGISPPQLSLSPPCEGFKDNGPGVKYWENLPYEIL